MTNFSSYVYVAANEIARLNGGAKQKQQTMNHYVKLGLLVLAGSLIGAALNQWIANQNPPAATGDTGT